MFVCYLDCEVLIYYFQYMERYLISLHNHHPLDPGLILNHIILFVSCRLYIITFI